MTFSIFTPDFITRFVRAKREFLSETPMIAKIEKGNAPKSSGVSVYHYF